MLFHPFISPLAFGLVILTVDTLIAIVLTLKVNYYSFCGASGWFRQFGLFEIFWVIGVPLVLLAIPLRLLLGIRLYPVFVNPDRF